MIKSNLVWLTCKTATVLMKEYGGSNLVKLKAEITNKVKVTIITSISYLCYDIFFFAHDGELK